MKEFYRNFLSNNLYFWVFSITAIALIIISFVTPPQWIIDASVLGATGELFAFAALGAVIRAIDSGKTAKISKGDIDVHIGDADDLKNID